MPALPVCHDCGTPVPPGEHVCPACLGTDIDPDGRSRPGVEPRQATPFPLPAPWEVLERWPDCNVVTVDGPKGSGKSTLAWHLHPDLWMSAEQTPAQAARIARRAGAPIRDVVAISDAGDVGRTLDAFPHVKLPVIDSLTALGREGGLSALVRLVDWSRERHGRRGCAVIQRTKRGDAAGYEALAHMVDAVCAVELDDQGLRLLTVDKNREGPLDARYFTLGGKGVGVPDFSQAVYSVEGTPGAYRLHPYPLSGATWAGWIDPEDPPPPGHAGCGAPYGLGRMLLPQDVAERRAFALAHGLEWIDTTRIEENPE